MLTVRLFALCSFSATQMGHDVQKAIIDIISEAQCVSTEEATKVFESLQTDGRYIQELWS